MRIVVLTNRCTHGAALLRAMAKSGIAVDAIIIERPKRRGPLQKLRRAWRRGLDYTVKVALKRLRAIFWPRPPGESVPEEFYHAYTDRVHVVPNVNGRACRALLRKIAPDVIVLGGSRIVRKPLIETARIGVLNAHPGLLPAYRGVDVVAWAVHNGDPVGVTMHFVDDGVDTGGIIAQETLTPQPGDGLAELSTRAEELAGRLMAQALLELREGQHVAPIAQTRPQGRQYYRMPPYLRRRVDRKLRK